MNFSTGNEALDDALHYENILRQLNPTDPAYSLYLRNLEDSLELACRVEKEQTNDR